MGKSRARSAAPGGERRRVGGAEVDLLGGMGVLVGAGRSGGCLRAVPEQDCCPLRRGYGGARDAVPGYAGKCLSCILERAAL